jgi:hypothetical protein
LWGPQGIPEKGPQNLEQRKDYTWDIDDDEVFRGCYLAVSGFSVVPHKLRPKGSMVAFSEKLGKGRMEGHRAEQKP